MAQRPNRKAVRQAIIVSNRPLGTGRNPHNYLLELEIDHTFDTVPGEFIEITLSSRPSDSYRALSWDPDQPTPLPTTGSELRERQPLLNRPFSIAGIDKRDEHAQVFVIYKVRGPGTTRLATLGPGEKLTVLGPLGKSGFSATTDLKRAVLVAGGIGLPPLLFWTDLLTRRSVPVVLIAGARTASQLPLPQGVIEQTPRSNKAHGIPDVFLPLTYKTVNLQVATEDGTAGTAGRATDLLERTLANKPADEQWTIYGCGPWDMLRSVFGLVRNKNVECQVSLEQMMGCGIGTCQSCIVKVRASDPPHWQYKLCCTDGPVFDARDVIWD